MDEVFTHLKVTKLLNHNTMKVEINLGKGNETPKNEKPKNKSAGGYHTRKIRRVKGKLEESPESSISSTEIYADDNKRKRAAKLGDGSFSGTAAPRTGGDSPFIIKSDKQLTGGSKKLIRKSKVQIRKNSASPQAKKSAKRALGY